MRNVPKPLLPLIACLALSGCGGGEEQKATQEEAEETQEEAEKKQVQEDALRALIRSEYAKLSAEERRNARPFGGLRVLEMISEAEESGATELYLRDNQISDLTPLAGLTKLETLYLRDNQISDLTPLAGLTKLKRLRLSYNKITDLSPLAGLKNLVHLHVGGNQITDLTPLVGLTKLESVWLFANPIPEDQKEMLKKALPNCRVWD